MSIPKRKNNIQIYKQKELSGRREELLNEIINNDTFLPESLLHDDLDRGMLDYVLKYFIVTSNGQQIPIIPKILTIQRWGEVSNTWEYIDDDNNIQLPFISIVRKPDVQPGTNPSVQRTIPDRKTFYYRSIPNWNGTKKGFNIYKIPQPVPVDITFEVSIVTNEIRDLNKLNKIILQKFSSRQSYTTVKGHYIPIVLNNLTDNSTINNNDSRRFYLQTYSFTMLGLILDEEEFEVIPGIDRTLITTEFIINKKINKEEYNKEIDVIVSNFIGNKVQTTYSVGESIGVLLYVTINGLAQTQDIDFFHIGSTSKITFVTPPQNGDKISISYVKNASIRFIDTYGRVFKFMSENFIYDGSSLDFTLENNIIDILYLKINGLVDNVEYGYMFNNNIITLNFTPIIGSEIGISYIY